MTEETLGQKLRRLRRKRGKTLVDVASASGFSAGFLSQAERDMTGLSLSSLSNIAQALGVPISELFTSPAQAAPDSHAGQRQSYTLDNMPQRYERLSSNYPGNVLNAVKLSLPPGYCSEEVAHGGDEFVYVLSGNVVYQVNGHDYPLTVGDSLHFNPMQKHTIRNDSPNFAELISVGTLSLFDDTPSVP